MPQDDLKPHDSWLIGSAKDCDLRVAKETVSGHHCRLVQQANGFTLEDLGSTNGTHVSGVRLAPGQPIHIAYGTAVKLGRQAEMPWPPEQTTAPPPIPQITRSPLPSPPTPRPAAGPAPGRPITIGRSPESDVQIDLPNVSWNHATITVENGEYVIEDLNSRNGTAIGELQNRIQRAVLRPTDEVYLGAYKISAAQLLSVETKVEIGEASFSKIEFRGKTMDIGRDPECDIPVDNPIVSWRHARITRAEEGMYVEDLGSRNGTYVGGIRVTGRVLVTPGQEIGLGSIRFQLLENGELAQRDYNGKVTIEAHDIVVNAPNGKRLLNAVSLTIFPYELVALMGPAGAGKTTLLKALNGYTRPAQGTVLFRGQSLYDYYDLYRHMMGYVPQDDIVHPQLTVRQALYFSARLRTDLTDTEIDARTEKVLTDLGIPDIVDTIIGSPERKTLSGGQRKRVNIALELITDTPVLFLDEPTSGLSSYDAESVVDLLKNLSKTGKAIVTTIHQPSLKVYKQFDNLIMISRDMGNNPGAMVFFGPAYPDSIQFFNPLPPNAQTVATPQKPAPDLNPEMLFSGMNSVAGHNRTETWRQRYLRSHYQQEFVTNRSGQGDAVTDKTGEEKPRRELGLGQWFALVKRNVMVKMQDRTQTAILLLQAPLFAILVSLVTYPLSANDFLGLMEKLPIVHFLMVVAAIWFGCNNAARDIVGEWTIYKRERMVTLKLLPYVFSKLAVLLALCIFQCGSMLAIVYLVLGLHSNFLLDFLVLLIASMIGAGMGLCISAVARTNEAAIALLPVILLPIIALGGGMRPIYQMPQLGQILSRAIPSRWAFEATLLQEAKAKMWKPPVLSPDAAQPLKPPNPFTKPGSPESMEPVPVDFAQHHIPSYVVTVKDSAGADVTRPAASTENQAIVYRHRFRDSMAVLCGMFVFLVAAVILILRKRDKDPQ